MELAVISDVHANLVAFEAVLEDCPDVDATICAGDVVGYNPWPRECLEIVRDREIPTVQGNHDRAVAAGSAPGFNALAEAGVEHAREQLDDDQLDWLAQLPLERRVADGRVKVVHGHPADPDHYTRPNEFGPHLLDDEAVLVMGHTHVQHHEIYDEGVVLNPGSVGQPRDGDPEAAYALLDLEERTVEERRVAYDVDRVIEAVEAAGLPRKIGLRLKEGW